MKSVSVQLRGNRSIQLWSATARWFGKKKKMETCTSVDPNNQLHVQPDSVLHTINTNTYYKQSGEWGRSIIVIWRKPLIEGQGKYKSIGYSFTKMPRRERDQQKQMRAGKPLHKGQQRQRDKCAWQREGEWQSQSEVKWMPRSGPSSCTHNVFMSNKLEFPTTVMAQFSAEK